MIIFGLGTGRCGTLSLAKLLNSQQNSVITHEQFPLLTWKVNNNSINLLDQRIKAYLQTPEIYTGDVCSVYLNYVKYIYNRLDKNVKFICLERDKQSNIDSWLKKTKNYNNWSIYSKGSRKYSKMFPKYKIQNKKMCLETYWEEYKYISDTLSNTIPVFRKYSTEDLNNELKINEILEFCSIKNPRILKIKSNSTKNSTI
jgi:hypothetical protein